MTMATKTRMNELLPENSPDNPDPIGATDHAPVEGLKYPYCPVEGFTRYCNPEDVPCGPVNVLIAVLLKFKMLLNSPVNAEPPDDAPAIL